MGLHLFEGFGVEIEYTIVDAEGLAVRPICDRVLEMACGRPETEVEQGSLCWSNELCLHVIELKTNGPAGALAGLEDEFSDGVRRISRLLRPLGARLMPAGMHPTMDPLVEARLWPHEYGPVYEAFDRIFGCRGHGWANLQSTHLNLPFQGDDEFGRLHAAIRCVLPLLPALAASSPYRDGARSGLCDTRLEVYRTNSKRIPSVTGLVVPEPVFRKADYDSRILDRIYGDLAPHDPEGVLRHEWVNARGAIARFQRDTIEVRLLDCQECPRADIAILAAVTGAIRALVEERLSSYDAQKSWASEPLHEILMMCIQDGDEAVVAMPDYLDLFAYPGERARAGEIWAHIVESTLAGGAGFSAFEEPLRIITREGCLSRRILRAVEDRGRSMHDVYAELCDCLEAGRVFRG